MAYIETPRTDAGNATYMSNAHNLENFSVEPSLLSPLKRKDDLVSQMRNGRGVSLKTPRARVPFSDRRNLPGVPGRGEFTPLLQSVARKNLERNGKLSGGPETPAFLKASYQGGNTPALPGAEVSAIYGSDFDSSVLVDGEGTPMPQVASSSSQSTPLAVLPKRDATGVLMDQGNLMTLREQENVCTFFFRSKLSDNTNRSSRSSTRLKKRISVSSSKSTSSKTPYGNPAQASMKQP